MQGNGDARKNIVNLNSALDRHLTVWENVRFYGVLHDQKVLSNQRSKP